MSEVHRYQVVSMLSMAGATIGYDPHGPDVVMAAEFDRVTAERDALQQRLTAADERADVLEGLLRKCATDFEGIEKFLIAFHAENESQWCGYRRQDG